MDELAGMADLSVDTIRYYQTRGLLHPPARDGRRAVYDDGHVARLGRIRELSERGYSLRSIEELLGSDADAGDARLRAELETPKSDAVYTRKAFAKTLGIPATLLAAVERTGLAAPQTTGRGDPRYTESDLAAARGALKLLDRGLPLTDLLTLAVDHHRAVAATVDKAIDLFDDHVRKPGDEPATPDEVADAYRDIMPVVTTLVAHHFQRVLVNRALERLEASGEKRTWRTALKEAARARLTLSWR